MDEIPPTTAMDMTSNDSLGWNARDRKDPVAGTRRPPASAPIAPETANAVSFARVGEMVYRGSHFIITNSYKRSTDT